MNLLSMDNLENEQIMDLINEAIDFKNGKVVDFKFKKVVSLLFFEPSTRTQYSFDVAARRLNCQVISFDPGTSSLVKGETLVDTIATFDSFNVDAMVIRHSQDRYFDALESIKAPILNGGDGSSNHPTQSLLDLMTIYEEFGYFEGLNVVICGDVRHSRVASSNYATMTRLGMNVSFCAPDSLRGDTQNYVDLDDVLETVDVVMLLRVQLERHDKTIDVEHFNRDFGMNMDRLRMTKDHTIIMHPAPFNIDVEITRDVVEHEKSRIFKQSENGVYMRMAVLHEALS